MSTHQPKPAAHTAPAGGSASAAHEYSGEVRSGWVEFLAALPGNARIVDIGFGNHVVALIAADLAASRGCRWTIDTLASQGGEPLRPADHPLVERIGFHACDTPLRLPFESATFDAAGGQHVLEFFDSAAVLAEVFRVMKPGTDAQFILHHVDSPVIRAATISLREADLVFRQSKAFRRLYELVTMSHIVPESTERASNEVREAIRALKRALPPAQEQGGGRVLSVALDSIQHLLSARRELKPDVAGLEVERAESELRGSVRRLNNLVAHACDESRMQQIADAARAVGFNQIEIVPQSHANTHVMGWQLILHRP